MADRPSIAAPCSGSGDDGDLTPFERAIDRALFWPFDLGAKAAERLPDAAGKVRDQLVFARFIGRLAVQQGNVEIRRRLERPQEHATGPATEESPDERVVERPDGDTDVAVGDLALPDYDQLPAAHIIEKLDALTPDERAMIESYETAHRGRRTVLGKLERLRS